MAELFSTDVQKKQSPFIISPKPKIILPTPAKDLLTIQLVLSSLSLKFLDDVINDCVQSQVNKIFFVSRDGTFFYYLLKAQIEADPSLKSKLGEIELKHLYVNRRAVLWVGCETDNQSLVPYFEVFRAF
jgi:hypothetical protein